MAIRFAAASGLILAAALVVAQPARAQGFFSFYEMSPRQIVGMLEDDGYELRGPMTRRGDVYVADVTSVSGRSARLIVSAHDGRIVGRYAAAPRWRNSDDEETTRVARGPRDYGGDTREQDRPRRGDMAMGDVFNPPSRVYGNDSLFSSKPTPPAAIPDDQTFRPKHRTAKKHKDSNVAKAPATPPTPDATPAAEAPKPADAGSSVAAVAPNPSPEPKKPDAQPVKPAAEAAPKAAASPEPRSTKVEVEKRATAEPTPAPAPVRRVDAPRKKLNDLPVGTLD